MTTSLSNDAQLAKLKRELKIFCGRNSEQETIDYLTKTEYIELIDSFSKRDWNDLDHVFRCKVCDQTFDSGYELRTHLQHFMHKVNARIETLKVNFKSTIFPRGNIERALTATVKKAAAENSLSPGTFCNRKKLINSLSTNISAVPELQDVSLMMTGPVACGFGIKGSATDIGIVVPKNLEITMNMMFTKIISVLHNFNSVTNVRDLRQLKKPLIEFDSYDQANKQNHTFHMRVLEREKELEERTISTLLEYSKNCENIRKLGVVFSVWARKRMTDCVNKGGINPIAFPILTIFYCQQWTSILKIDAFGAPRELPMKSDENLGFFWRNMLAFYGNFRLKDPTELNISTPAPNKLDACDAYKLVIIDPSGHRLTAHGWYMTQILYDIIDSCIYYNNSRTYYQFPLHHDMEMQYSREDDMLNPCLECNNRYHKTEACASKYRKPPLTKKRGLNQEELNGLDQVFDRLKDAYLLDQEGKDARMAIANDIQQKVHIALGGLYGGLNVEVYGSTINEIGSKDCDVDMVFLPVDPNVAKTRDAEHELLEDICEVIKTHSDEYELVQFQSAAQIPILFVVQKALRIDIDISVHSSVLGVHNSKLCARYTEVDNRTQTLAFALKYFAKHCQMAKTNLKSPPSFGYATMMIHFLQQRTPPVLPLLQKIFKTAQRPQILCNEVDVYYFEDDNAELNQYWQGDNNEQVSKLWVDFLDYFSNNWNYDNVIGIRETDILTKYDKLWNTKIMAIENTFEPQRNLAQAVNKTSFARIIYNFKKALTIFTSPMKPPSQNRDPVEYYFRNPEYQLSSFRPRQ